MFTFYVSLNSRYRQYMSTHQTAQAFFKTICFESSNWATSLCLRWQHGGRTSYLNVCCSLQLFCGQWCVLTHQEHCESIFGLGYSSYRMWWQNPEVVVEQTVPFHFLFQWETDYMLQLKVGIATCVKLGKKILSQALLFWASFLLAERRVVVFQT